jgi:hypothetical protein
LSGSIYTADAQTPFLLHLDSQPGDYIGGGIQSTLTPVDGIFTPSRTFDGGIQVIFNGGAANFWMLNFSGPSTQLAPGNYEDATRWPFQSPTKPGLSVIGRGGGCNELTGRFTVLEAVYGVQGAVNGFAVDFEQHCEGAVPALFGQLRVNSSIPVTGACSLGLTDGIWSIVESTSGNDDVELFASIHRKNNGDIAIILLSVDGSWSYSLGTLSGCGIQGNVFSVNGVQVGTLGITLAQTPTLTGSIVINGVSSTLTGNKVF